MAITFKYFEYQNGIARDVRSESINGLYQTGSGADTAAAVYGGTLAVNTGTHVPGLAGTINKSAYIMNPATAATTGSTELYVAYPNGDDPAIKGTDLEYNVGNRNVLGRQVPKGSLCTFIKINEGDKWLGFGSACFTAAPTVGQYAVLAADGQLTPSASLPTGDVHAFKVDSTFTAVGGVTPADTDTGYVLWKIKPGAAG
jgi:hypothetical protein